MTYISSPPCGGGYRWGETATDIAPPPQPSPIEGEGASTEGMEGEP
jgi:hypothetical protein